MEKDPSRPIKRVYNEVAGGHEDRGEDMSVFEAVRTKMYRSRQENMPPIPGAIQDVQIEGEWAGTWSGRRFLSLVDNARGVAIFN